MAWYPPDFEALYSVACSKVCAGRDWVVLASSCHFAFAVSLTIAAENYAGERGRWTVARSLRYERMWNLRIIHHRCGWLGHEVLQAYSSQRVHDFISSCCSSAHGELLAGLRLPHLGNTVDTMPTQQHHEHTHSRPALFIMGLMHAGDAQSSVTGGPGQLRADAAPVQPRPCHRATRSAGLRG